MDARPPGLFPRTAKWMHRYLRQTGVVDRMTKYVYIVVLAGLFASGCQKPARPTTADEGTADRSGSSRAGTVEIPARTQFYVRVDKTLDSAKAKQGDLVKGTLDSPIVAGGREVLPHGTDLDIRITNAKVASEPGSVGLLTLDVETAHHRGADYRVKATPVTVETSPVAIKVQPDQQIPHLPLTQAEGRANAVLDPNRALLFETIEPIYVKP